MMKVFIYPECGWIGTVSRRKEVELPPMQRRADAAIPFDLCRVFTDERRAA